MTSASEPAWAGVPPSAFQIVACWYPLPSAPKHPGPKLRPGLVVAVYRRKSGGYACQIAYGTSQLKVAKRQHVDLIVQNHGDIGAFGLANATRFDLDNIAILPWSGEFFGCWGGRPSPVLGATLSEPYQRDFAYKMYLRKSA